MAGTAGRGLIIAVTTALGVATGLFGAYYVPYRFEASTVVLISHADPADSTAIAPETLRSLTAVAQGSEVSGRVDTVMGSDSASLKATSDDVAHTIRIVATSDGSDTAASAAKVAAKALHEWVKSHASDVGQGLQTQVTADPTTPEHEVYPPRPYWIAAAGVLGAFVGLVLSLPTRRRRERGHDLDGVTTVDELKADAGAPVLGVISRDAELAAGRLTRSLPQTHPAAEAMRIVRTNLEFRGDGERLRTITVTSPLPAEGKSTTSCHLGVALAQAGRNVVVVEGDLRRPQLAEYLDVDERVGLTSFLTGRTSLGMAVQRTRFPGLDVLASGPMPPNPAEILGTPAMANLIADLAGMYDVVLIDAPPVLPVADAAILAAYSDGVVLVVRYGTTGRDQVRAAVERVNVVGARVVGAVLSMSPRHATERYGYGYGYGSGPGIPAHGHHRGRH